MTGAAVLASLAALRAGCGLVSLGVPQSLNAICEVKATEVITRPLPEVKDKAALAARALGEILKWLEPAQCLVLGCGVGRHHETRELLGRLVERQTAPLVLDADGLHPFGQDPDRLVRHRAPLVITPHPGELAHLLGVTSEEVQADRLAMARRAARHFDCVCVLKGATTVVASVTGQAYLNPTGNSGMGTAGAGDVLAGMIGSLVAQGMSMLGAATAGAYLHGLAGDLAAQIVGERGLIASDLLDSLPDALQSVESDEWAGYY
jgi:NAD(P)H-hydrate epimerase